MSEAPDNDSLGEEIEELKSDILSLLSDELDTEDPEIEANRWKLQKDSNKIIDAVVKCGHKPC